MIIDGMDEFKNKTRKPKPDRLQCPVETQLTERLDCSLVSLVGFVELFLMVQNLADFANGSIDLP